jgi:hypothetical protein
MHFAGSKPTEPEAGHSSQSSCRGVFDSMPSIRLCVPILRQDRTALTVNQLRAIFSISLMLEL